jgi:hypothetical protein
MMVEDDLEEFFGSDEERRRFFSDVNEPAVKRERFITGVNVSKKYYTPSKRASGTVIESKNGTSKDTMKHIVPGVAPTGDDRPSVTSVETDSPGAHMAKAGALLFVMLIVMFLVILIMRGDLMP